ncbi:MAG: hypothetical protein ACK45Z_09740, partial [Dolichospermum sp.]
EVEPLREQSQSGDGEREKFGGSASKIQEVEPLGEHSQSGDWERESNIFCIGLKKQYARTN